jgi:predicted Abi (CAAX) family protease
MMRLSAMYNVITFSNKFSNRINIIVSPSGIIPGILEKLCFKVIVFKMHLEVKTWLEYRMMVLLYLVQQK